MDSEIGNVKQNKNKKLSKSLILRRTPTCYHTVLPLAALLNCNFIVMIVRTLTLMSRDEVSMKVLFWLAILFTYFVAFKI